MAVSGAMRTGQLLHRPASRYPARWRATLLVTLSTLLASAASSVFTADAAAQEAFSADERRHLRAGRLVTRPTEERRGDLRLMGGTSFQVLEAPPELVWRVVQDMNAYRHFLPEVERVRTVGPQSRARRVIRVTHKRGPVEASYHLRIDYAHSIHSAQFRVDHDYDNDVREGWGYVRVQPYGSDRTLLTWAVFADPGRGITIGLMRQEIHRWILEVPGLMKLYLAWARERYEN